MALSPRPPSTRAERRALADLRRAPVRRQTGLWLVEGATLLGEALAAGRAPQVVAVTDELAERHADLLERAAGRGARLVALAPGQVDGLADREHGPGLLASVEAPAPWDGALAGHGPALVLALAGIQDPGNVGTLLRAARAFGAAGAWLLPGCADPGNPKVLRASAGAALALPWARLEGPDALLGRSEATGLPLLAAQAPGRVDGAAAHDLPARALLLLGHETRGVPALAGARPVVIPQAAEVESLNVAMAGAILLAGWYAARTAAP